MPRVEAIALYELVGSRDAVVAPNACTGVRPAEAREDLLLVLADNGAYGVANWRPRSASAPDADLGWLVGLDPRDAFRWRRGLVVGLDRRHARLLTASRSVDVALLDLCARLERVPLWRLLGPEARRTVPAYDSTLYFEDLLASDGSAEMVARKALAAVGRGHRALKLKVGRGLRWMPWPECTERDVEVCRAVRDAVGPDVTLMVDANQGYRGYVGDAVDFLAETAECRLAFAEEMVGDDEISALRAAMQAAGLSIPLAGGEGADTAAWCERMWREGPLDILQPDICRTGLIEYLAIARFARNHGLRIAPHNFGSTFGVYESLHLGKVVPHYVACECDDSRFDAYEAPGYVLSEGAYTVPDAPGLGVQVADPRREPGETRA